MNALVALGGQSETVFNFPFWKDVSVREVTSRAKGPRVRFAKLICNLGDGVVSNGSRAGIQLPKNQGVGECVGEALVVDHRTENS